ncbi:DNA-binding protein [Leifsonia xyli subsp. cynodontis DSM 46306]|uniref:Methylated-DNA-[protein]-cysteine S-methyltransferase DNA binding domain-containing protein n=1 Tax=Leifsonia xyli subsp. cynodontis DSM 46306 TaxID=1389489 RepID=U3P4R2_LEIXC|nr:MGMT family protein [Leifsonia xyli]AGW40766.1 DNA-binding protein [Leifsonia xyli subsp. cynodontis DSM 46306]
MPSNSEPAVPGGEQDDFASRVLAVVGEIPPGRVMTYGDVAAALGSRAARRVGQALAHFGSGVPWWRVVRASGHPAVNHEHSALERYRAERTPLLGVDGPAYRVDLRNARHRP